MLSDAFKGLVNQFDADQIQYMIWRYEVLIEEGYFKKDDIDKVMLLISYLKTKIGQREDITSTVSKLPICLN